MKRALAFIWITSSACVTGAGTVAKPTALERQLLGAYEELDEQLASAASVRAGGDPTTVSFSQLESLAIEARATQRFNADDVADLKVAGCLAETLRAKLTLQTCSLATNDEAAMRRAVRIVDEENRARQSILTWAGYELARRDGKPGPSNKEMVELTSAFQRLLYEAAKTGHVIEREPGTFVRVQ